jgi:hypothetical protein
MLYGCRKTVVLQQRLGTDAALVDGWHLDPHDLFGVTVLGKRPLATGSLVAVPDAEQLLPLPSRNHLAQQLHGAVYRLQQSKHIRRCF